MKSTFYLIFSLILLSCSANNPTQIEQKRKPTEELKFSFSKLPEQKLNQSSLNLLKGLELDTLVTETNIQPIGKYIGKELYTYSYSYDTVVNNTPILFVYQCIGSLNKDIISQQMLSYLNSWINELIETAETQQFKALYSVAYDEVEIKGEDLIYTRTERQFTGGAGEFYTSNAYRLNHSSINQLFNKINNYKTDSDFLKKHLINKIEK